MTKKVWLVLLTVSLFIFTGCGKAVYEVRNENVPVKLTEKQMGNAISNAAERRGWIVKKVSKNVINATYFRGKYMAKVAIKYSKSTYSINYLDSKNLNYDGQKIHGTYNKWVLNLENTIDRKLTEIGSGYTSSTGSSSKGASNQGASLQSLGFKVGKTTKIDVMERMGRPTSTSYSSDGQEVLLYNKTRVTGKAWIPFYYGRDRVRVQYMSFTFKNNILTGFSESHN